ncbi:MAG TPA: M48 family metalloprotease [Sphingomicrobium sp.]|jgi:predicted Zn-dependent protease
MRKALLLFTAAALAITPAAAQRGLRYLDPRDVADAQRGHAELLEEYGGAETGPRAAYVQAVGRRVGAFSGIANPNQALQFTVLNAAVENALSVPGGYIYITRQLMGLMNDESELAFAVGHEVGHVAANHAHIREQYSRQNPLGVFGQILGAVFGDQVLGGMLQQRAQLQQLSFSRDQEYQADTLGMRYMLAAGYDPAGAAQLLAALSRQKALQARVEGRTNRQTPEWASTHPLSENRMQRALVAGQQTGRLGTGVRNRDGFLAQLDGVYVDDDPAQGIIDGPVFTHPDLRIQFRVPAGYLMSNGTYAVTVAGSAGKAQFSGGAYRGSLENYVASVFQALTQGQYRIAAPPPQRLTINGMQAAVTTARINTNSGLIDASVVAYQWDPQRVYHFLMLTRGGTGIGPFTPMISSLRKISQAEASAIRPRVIQVVTVGRGDTIQSLAARMAYRDLKLERFLTLNGLAANSPLVPGQRVKLAVYGVRRNAPA